MVEKFVRDTTKTIYPQLYHDFKAQGQNLEDDPVHFFVEDLTENKFNDVIEFLVKNHELSAEFAKNFNLKNSDGSDKAPRVFYREILNKKLSLICTKPGSRDVVAVIVMIVKSRDNDDDISKIDDSELFIENDVDYFLQCVCFVIHPTYKDRSGVINELIKAQLTFLSSLDDVRMMSTEISSPEKGKLQFDLEKISSENSNFQFEIKNCQLLSKKV